MPLPTPLPDREEVIRLTLALLKLPPTVARRMMAEETARRAKIRAAEAKQPA